MQRVAKRLKQLTEALLKEKNADPETYKAYTEELRAIRELVATHKAVASYREEFGDDFDEDDVASGTPKDKRKSTTQWL
ncbi:MAG: hypothetical protein IIU75_04735 [Rikenellaceae bacterium]|nr:hypothetical protein [Rikenellaceae bacterium]